MGISKVIFNNSSLIDLTQDTVTANDVRRGVSFHDACGDAGVGVMDQGEDPMYVPEHSLKVFFSNSLIDKNVAPRQLMYYAKQNENNLLKVDLLTSSEVFPINKTIQYTSATVYDPITDLRIEIIGNNFTRYNYRLCDTNSGGVNGFFTSVRNNCRNISVYTENFFLNDFSLTSIMHYGEVGSASFAYHTLPSFNGNLIIEGSGSFTTGMGCKVSSNVFASNLQQNYLTYNYTFNQKNVDIYGELFFYSGTYNSVNYITYKPLEEMITDINNIEHINLYTQLPLLGKNNYGVEGSINIKPHISFKYFKQSNAYINQLNFINNTYPGLFSQVYSNIINNLYMNFNHLSFYNNAYPFYINYAPASYNYYYNYNLINRFYANILEGTSFINLNINSNDFNNVAPIFLNQLNSLLDQINYFDMNYLSGTQLYLNNKNYKFNNHKNLLCFPAIHSYGVNMNNANLIIDEPYITKIHGYKGFGVINCYNNSYYEINCQNLRDGSLNVPFVGNNSNCIINAPLYNGNGIHITGIERNSSIYLDVPNLKNISNLFYSSYISSIDSKITINGVCNVINATNTFYGLSIYSTVTNVNNLINYAWVDDNIFTEHLISANGMFNNSNIKNGFIDRPLNLYKCKNLLYMSYMFNINNSSNMFKDYEYKYFIFPENVKYTTNCLWFRYGEITDFYIPNTANLLACFNTVNINNFNSACYLNIFVDNIYNLCTGTTDGVNKNIVNNITFITYYNINTASPNFVYDELNGYYYLKGYYNIHFYNNYDFSQIIN